MYYQSREENNLPKALGLSALVMGVLVLIGFFVVFGGQEIPRYGMGGIIVNYGTADEGMGDDYMSVDEPSMDENANNVKPDKIDPETTPVPTPSKQVADKVVATQDMDDAPAVPKNEKPVKANADVSTVEKKNATPAVNPNALYKGKKNNAVGTGDGTGTTPGNQGSKLGDPLASNYGEGGSGDGNMMLTIANRRFEVRPNIQDDGQQAGRVAVEFSVNRSGVVTRARAGVKGTTISSRALLEKCERAVMGARLNQLPNAPDSQTGVIVFNFKLR
ncbi:energy transducer TonB [Sphingobacterium psychroaquaticum]|uniref:Protein TonB, links inner and outer membranes n=1 Tax=Sphingobacterium psychroaquaticum TaxID=561061 RepID=A0A1X7KNZ5_9SPHI|nr:energy transducer TonB [Sphingobacterium psychroaquaticum]QBQ40511.1 energy transducer TonB [Sphingobacterium psychroaquaticum]SMG42943.1 protein TonB, links inner and outer membranes [Sphingobacterium psychroaquaticum]